LAFEVDHKLVFRGRLYRKVGGLLPLEDAVNITSRTTVLVDVVRTIENQAAVGNEATKRIDRR